MVSVIIPNYNHAPYLKQRIDTVLNQSYQDFEVIILDDCSTDDSREIIEHYRHHPKVSQIVYNESNSGTTFRQWQKGMLLAKGDWIWIAESDDYCEPNFLQELVHITARNENAVIGYCQSIMFANDNNILAKTQWSSLSSAMKNRDWIVQEMLGTCGLCNASMAIFKKSALEGFDWSITDFKLCGDWFFWTQVARKGDVSVSGKYLNYFRKHNKSASNSPSKYGAYYKEGIRVFQYAVDAYGLTEEEIEIGLARYIKHFYYNISEIENPEIKREVWTIIYTIHPQKAAYILGELQKAARRNKWKSGLRKILSLPWLMNQRSKLVQTKI